MVYRPTARVLSVLELLQTRGQMTAQELAVHLEVDARTVRRYITTLQDIGIPVDSEIGRYGGYMLRPGFKLPPLMFTDEEVLVLTLGLLMARRSTLAGAEQAVASAILKIERVLRLSLRERLRALIETMQLEDALPPRGSSIEGDVLANLSLANRQRQQVRLGYRTRETTTERIFDPYAVICHQEQWYTVGYCHLRRALRTFRLDRIQRVIVLNSPFTPPSDFDAIDYMLSSFEAIPDLWNVEVVLDMPLDVARQRIPRELASLVQSGEGIRLRASIRDLNEMARRLIALGCPLKVIGPPELRAELLAIAAQITQFAQEPAD